MTYWVKPVSQQELAKCGKREDLRHKGHTREKREKENKSVRGMPVALRGEEGRDKLRKATGICK